MKRVSVLVYRQENFSVTQAVVVSVDKTRKVHNSVNLLNMLVLAITQWMINTQEGRKAWGYAGGDFNIGDLASGYVDHKGPCKSLQPFLKRHGITSLTVESFDTDEDWTYDTALVDGNDVYEALDS